MNATDDSPTENKATVAKFYQAFAADDLDALRGLLHPELRAYRQGADTTSDLAQHLATIAGWNAAMSSTRFDVLEQICEGDVVASRVVMHAVHDRGPFQGLPPSGRTLRVPAVTWERIADGRIIERRVMSDSLGMAQQLTG